MRPLAPEAAAKTSGFVRLRKFRSESPRTQIDFAEWFARESAAAPPAREILKHSRVPIDLGPRRDMRKLGWCVWSVYAILWTAALVSPYTGPEHFGAGAVLFNLSLKFLIAKSLHLSAYAVWTILTGWLRPLLPWRFFLLFLLMSHAVGTEIIQQYVGRNGILEDAALDQLGILIGLAVSWRWWADVGRGDELPSLSNEARERRMRSP